VAIGTIRKNVEHQEISGLKSHPPGNIQSMRDLKKMTSFIRVRRILIRLLSWMLNKKASGIPALYLKQHKSVEKVLSPLPCAAPPDERD
jgi:hypothetical protein